MSAKRRPLTRVPEITDVIAAPSSSSRTTKATSDNATGAVTLETLAGHIEDIKAQIAIMVEWLETLDERTANED